MHGSAFLELRRAYMERSSIAKRYKEDGNGVIGCLGSDIPEEILIAGGYMPLRIYGQEHFDYAEVEHYIERAFDARVRSQFADIVGGVYSWLDKMLITTSSDSLVRAYYYLRELRRLHAELSIPELYFVDFLHTRFRTSALYNRARFGELVDAVGEWRGAEIERDELSEAIRICNENRRLLRGMNDLRAAENPRVTGVEALTAIGASMFMDRESHSAVLSQFLDEVENRSPFEGLRVFATGSVQDHSGFYELLEECGAVVVGEDHDWGVRHVADDAVESADPLDAILDRYHLRSPSAKQSTVSERIKELQKQVKAVGAEAVVFFILESDDPPSWDFPEQSKALQAMGVPFLLLDNQPYGGLHHEALRQRVTEFIEAVRDSNARHGLHSEFEVGESDTRGVALQDEKAKERPKPRAGSGGKASVKRLESAANASRHQKEWFRDVQRRVEEGEPFGIVNADVPQEILRAMDIDYVVNQWWASVCSAKQLSPRYFGLMEDRGYRGDLCRYCSLSLASALDSPSEDAPWGGLPKPTFGATRLTCDAQAKIFDLWAKQFDIPIYYMENTVPTYVPDRWWEKVAWEWEDVFQADRLDLLVEEMKGFIRALEIQTGKTFSETRFKRIMELINEQEEYNRRTRDLIARTVPAPIGIVDQVPSVMIPQWHRGTEWAVEVARSFYEEVEQNVAHGEGVCGREQARLMWLGTGLWFNLGFYQHFEERYGAAFVWSIYLALAADGYMRYGGDPLRALASRFVGMEDMLHMPPWNSDWYVSEAEKSGIDGVVHLVAESCVQAVQGSYFIKKAFEDAGIPVLEIRADTVDSLQWDEPRMIERLEDFLETRLGVKPL